MISFLFFIPLASQPSINFNISELVYFKMLKNVGIFVRGKVLPDSCSNVPVSITERTGTTVCVACSQSPVFRKVVRGSSSYWYGGHLGFICTEGTWVGV